MTFTLTINLGNKAMSSVNDVALTLIRTGERLAAGGELSGTLQDRNGNTVGQFSADEWPASVSETERLHPYH